MPRRVTSGVEFVTNAPCKYSNQTVEVYVEPANSAVLEEWHKNVQLPHIDTDGKRIDNGWNWVFFNTGQRKLGELLGQEPECYSICVKNNYTNIPMALVYVAENMETLYNKESRSCYIWYFATAPDAYSKQFVDLDEIPKLGRLCVDIAISRSFCRKHSGVIGLHAAPTGGDKLLHFFQNHCGLNRLGNDVEITGDKENDGRYFYADEALALELSQAFDHLR